MTYRLLGCSNENFDCANLWIEGRLTAMWGDDFPLCLHVWMGICCPYLITPPHISGAVPRHYQHSYLHGNQSLCRSGIRLGMEGGGCLIFPLLIHANNTVLQPMKMERRERENNNKQPVVPGRWMDGWTRWHKNDVFMCNSCASWKHFICKASFCLRALKMRINSRLTGPSCLVHRWHWPPLFF